MSKYAFHFLLPAALRLAIFFADFPQTTSQTSPSLGTPYCNSSVCGDITISYPFWLQSEEIPSSFCGYREFGVRCSKSESGDFAELELDHHRTFKIIGIVYKTLTVTLLENDIGDLNCPKVRRNVTINPAIPLSFSSIDVNLVFYFNCTINHMIIHPPLMPLPCLGRQESRVSFVGIGAPFEWLGICEDMVAVPVAVDLNLMRDLVRGVAMVLRNGFLLVWRRSRSCSGCDEDSGEKCGYDNVKKQTICFCGGVGRCSDITSARNGKAMTPNAPAGEDTTSVSLAPIVSSAINGRKKEWGSKAGIGVVAVMVGMGLTCLVFFVYQRRKKKRYVVSTLLSRMPPSHTSPKMELDSEKSVGMYIGVRIFTYDELVEATNNFDSSQEVGDGGFGTVYHGKLPDGCHVAVKRLYENNYRRVEQFMNEVEILTRLRHENLVSLYGCTSRHSRELLLVYEYVPNGTVADHLHGPRSPSPALTWRIRVAIAARTASALAYLHRSDIVHRDVKTDNILVDDAFRVKVADFGLSRLFPTDMTHVSTAPQGTPGYVDPDYNRCYRLTSKSDVYSFGVVLMELVSAMPAVDITRPRDEINLSSMAIHRIQNNTVCEIVDPALGFEHDVRARRTVEAMAELAFRCLQDEEDLRPSMEEVVESLERMEGEISEGDDVSAKIPNSPDTVTAMWTSSATTPNTSS